jgi:hypothetical protein
MNSYFNSIVLVKSTVLLSLSVVTAPNTELIAEYWEGDGSNEDEAPPVAIPVLNKPLPLPFCCLPNAPLIVHVHP